MKWDLQLDFPSTEFDLGLGPVVQTQQSIVIMI